MKTVLNTENVEVTVASSELLEDRWISFQILSKKLADIEEKKSMDYKYLRNRFYNSRACNKYNMRTIAGILYIDTKEPMKAEASLTLSFKRG